jgi:uncharacterized protein (TIGR02147 family)
MTSIFDFKDYRTYLHEKIASFPHRGHGVQVRIASALRCQPAYVSRVLQGNADFSPEQADLINEFFGHSQEEADYFVLLVLAGRAGTKRLRAHFEKQIQEIQRRRLILKERFKIENELSDADRARYYSQWYFGAIHAAISVPRLQERRALARHLGIAERKVAEALDFLTRCGLVVEDHGAFRSGKTRIHLGAEAPEISKAHVNWRMQAVRSLENDRPEDLHYSSAVTLSRQDIVRIKSELIKKIEEIKAIVKESPEEELACFNVDFFLVGGAE